MFAIRLCLPGLYRADHTAAGSLQLGLSEGYRGGVVARQALAPEEVAAIFVEPIQGEGGYVVAPGQTLCASCGLFATAPGFPWWLLYALMILSLVGLFLPTPFNGFTDGIRFPFIGFNFQPSEFAKLIVVITLSCFQERNKTHSASPSKATFWGLVIVGIPFILILKQPDLGTALVLLPITLVMFYFGDFNRAGGTLYDLVRGPLASACGAYFLKSDSA